MARPKPRPEEPALFNDLKGISMLFDNMKKRWGAGDINLRFSAAPLWIQQPSLSDPQGQQAAAWYDYGTKSIVFNVPSLKKVARDQARAGGGRQYKGGLNDQVLSYALGVLTHELSHGLQSQEEAGEYKRFQEHGTPLRNPDPGWPHEQRQQDRTHILNEAELNPFIKNRLRGGLYEDDPMFEKAPELLPSFFGTGRRGTRGFGGKGAS